LLIHAQSVVPKDWKIIEASPGGVDLAFYNRKTGETTWYTPEGMSAEEMLQIPRARVYWRDKEQVEEFMERMATRKEKNNGYDVADALKKGR
jgi:hypothetical protein